MKLRNVLLASLALVLIAAPAWATHWETFGGVGDCYGWSADGSIVVRNTLPDVVVSYHVALMQGAAVIEEYSGTQTVPSTNPSATDVHFGGAWVSELCGDYSVEGSFEILVDEVDVLRTYQTSFTCDCPPDDDICHYTPGYWKNHPENWPVMDLEVGGVMYTQAELLDIFDWPTRGDITIILFHHLVAAKLNVLNGADDAIDVSITAGDDFLVANPLGSKPKQPAKGEGEMIKDALADYNEMGCPDDPMPVMMKTLAPELEPAPEAGDSWGAVKSLYR